MSGPTFASREPARSFVSLPDTFELCVSGRAGGRHIETGIEWLGSQINGVNTCHESQMHSINHNLAL